MKFETHGVLSASSGFLMGDIGELYKVFSYMLGRSAYTHELSHYGETAAEALQIAHPELPNRETLSHVNQDNVLEIRKEWETKLGSEFELSDALKDCLADEKNCLDTLKEMTPNASIITINQ